MPHAFIYDALPSRVIFGTLTPELLREETARIGALRPLIVATAPQRPQALELADMLGGRGSVCRSGHAHSNRRHGKCDIADLRVPLAGFAIIGRGFPLAMAGDDDGDSVRPRAPVARSRTG